MDAAVLFLKGTLFHEGDLCMSLDIKFTLSEQDLDYFRNILVNAQQGASEVDDASIIEHCSNTLRQINDTAVTSFISERLKKLSLMIAMLNDKEWPLEDQERLDVISALAYFYRADDLIANDVPTLGLIDDAIIIELIVRELKHEIDAYADFSEYRETAERFVEKEISREDWLKARKHESFERMRNRMNRHYRTSNGVGRLTKFSLS